MGLRRRRPAIQPDRVYLGKVLKPHALRGEVKFAAFGCDPWLLETLKRVRLESSEGELEIEYVRGSIKAPIVKFKGVDDRDGSEALVGEVLWTHPTNLPNLDEDAYYESDILFSEVLDEAGERLGRVESIIETGECDVLVIRAANGEELLLPANREVVLEVRKADSVIVARVPPEA